MASKQTAEVSVRILIDEEKKRVVCAEAGNDFLDILFSFLTLPMGTIVRLVRKQQSSQIGCMNSLYRSVENLSTSYLPTEACKDMLLHPRTPCETICSGLKVNIADTKPTKYFICSDMACCHNGYRLLSDYVNTKCKCGKLMNRELYVSGAGSSGNATDEVFVKRLTYIVSDNLQVMVSTPGALVELLGNVGIKDAKSLEEKVVKVGSEEILELLKHTLLSESPLTDVFLPKERFNPERSKLLNPRYHQFLSQNIPGRATNGSMAVKIMVRKSDGKALYAEAMEDFVDLLFSFLTISLANVLKCMEGKSSLGCVDNLYKNLQVLNEKWFVTHGVPWNHYPKCSNELLLDPGLAPNFRCSSQPFQLAERNADYYLHRKLSTDVCSLTFQWSSVHKNTDFLTLLTLIDPKTPNWETSSGNFVKRPAVFLVSDGLAVLPSASTTSSISYLKGLNVPIEDIEEHVIKINKQEALNLLKAALITTSALTNALNLPCSRKTKQEP
ncbi:hypothetical protein LOK49_LG10G02104 [Camellia lanceoleosa]|uniref:Uncharacterized protein n=1 Tax=Camellia lanceoleosa TaxID=1840588 RepID=A0ACC0GIC3_9ERIC|nr:hypothetical protein LOK49_LG10G02104 [Camellia lanceoleosa]